MGMSPYLKSLRAACGSRLLVLPSVTGIVFDAENRILLVHQRDVDVWSTPGGAVEPNEIPSNAVVREVWEETGLLTEPTRILGVFGGPECMITYPNGDQATYVTTVFECEVRGGALREASDETIAAGFVGPDDLPDYRTTAWASYILPRLFDRQGHGHFERPSWRPPRV
jgi:ADP-ribose pyrophosphatase YjhB (NUDIX family)